MALNDAYQLRALAEGALGIRNKLACLVNTNGVLSIQEYNNDTPQAGIVTMYYTADEVPNRPKPLSVDMTIATSSGTKTYPLLGTYDTAFWSESSWDKFVKPYYEQLMDESDFETMWTAIHDPTVVALVHLPTSQYAALPNAGPAVLWLQNGTVPTLSDNYQQFLKGEGKILSPL